MAPPTFKGIQAEGDHESDLPAAEYPGGGIRLKGSSIEGDHESTLPAAQYPGGGIRLKGIQIEGSFPTSFGTGLEVQAPLA